MSALNDAMWKGYNNLGAGTDSVFRWKASSGLVDGFDSGVQFGTNGDVDTGAEEDVWNVGGTLSYITVAQPLNIVSDSASDTVGSAGAEVLLVEGLDADFLEISEVVMMNGITTVTTTQDFFRLNEIIVLQSGAADGVANIGTINITASVDLTDQGQIDPGVGSLQNAHFTVPAKKVLLLEEFTTSTGNNDLVRVHFDTRDNEVGTPFIRAIQALVNSGITNVRVPGPISVSEKTDLRVRAQSLTNNSIVDVFYQYALIDIPGDNL
jgi:hypothetical protein